MSVAICSSFDYLRLAFKFGGFPGYEGRATVPTEIATLSVGLMEF